MPKPYGWEYMTPEDRAKCAANDKIASMERQRQIRTPHGIASANRKKRNGNLSFTLSEDGTTIEISTTTKNGAAETLIRRIAVGMGGELFTFDKGRGFIVRLKNRDPKSALAAANVKPEPEACVRCDGHGALYDSNDQPAGHLFSGSHACPACHGSGRAAPDPTAAE